MSKRRIKLSKKHSKRMFTKHAAKTHRKNVRPVVMRGGIRA